MSTTSTTRASSTTSAQLRRAHAAGIPVALRFAKSRTTAPLPGAIIVLIADALDAHAVGQVVRLIARPSKATGKAGQASGDSAKGTAEYPASDTPRSPYLILDRDPNDELTTQEAAIALRMSRPTVIKAIEEGRLHARKVGTHRRIRVYDLNSFAEADLAARIAHAGETDRLEQALGLYDIPLPKSRTAWKSATADTTKSRLSTGA